MPDQDRIARFKWIFFDGLGALRHNTPKDQKEDNDCFCRSLI